LNNISVIPVKLKTYIKPDGTSAKRPIKEQAYMVLAIEMAKLATCDRLQVGAVFTDKRMERVLCSGYNGNVAGGLNGCDSHEPGNCGCLHAENGALTKSQENLENSVCFVTTAPCIQCAKLLVNRRVSRVVYLQDYRKTDGLDLLKRFQIKVERYTDLNDE
jgi:dCMP deaminase